MTVALHELAAHLDRLLEVDAFSDYAPNGLQIEGRAEVHRIVTGVSANAAMIDRAIAAGADALVVHHGFFWSKEPRQLVGLRGRRVAALIRAGISLFAYHLPLDAHGTLGNNVGVLRAIGATPTEAWGGRPAIGWEGTFDAAVDRAEVVARLATATGRAPLVFGGGSTAVRRVGVVTGGGAGFFEEAAARGVDLFVTGEPSEQSRGLAEELGVTFVAAGHHATERFGPRSLGSHISETFGCPATFIDVFNPV